VRTTKNIAYTLYFELIFDFERNDDCHENFSKEKSSIFFLAKVPNSAANELFEEDFEKAGGWFEKALEVLPVLEDTR
jgi:hypothetical protein